jgi:tRNA nucleotidyltransferase/poly(A) polymerase
LDFEIESETKSAAISLGHRLSDISAERKSVELQKILLSDHADRGISLLLETDLAKYIHPEIKAPRVSLNSLPKRFSTRLAALFNNLPKLSCMKLSGEITKQTSLLCDDSFYLEATSKFTATDATARYMISKYGEIAEDAALLRENRPLAETIGAEREKNPTVSIKALAIGGNDLLNAGIEARKLGSIMSSLLLYVIETPEKNEKEALLKLALALA